MSAIREVSVPHEVRTAAEPRQNRLYTVRLAHVEQVNPSVRLVHLTFDPDSQTTHGEEGDEGGQQVRL